MTLVRDTWNHSESTRQIVLVRTLVIIVLVNEFPCVFLLSHLLSSVIQIPVLRHIGVHHPAASAKGPALSKPRLHSERKENGRGMERKILGKARRRPGALFMARRHPGACDSLPL